MNSLKIVNDSLATVHKLKVPGWGTGTSVRYNNREGTGVALKDIKKFPEDYYFLLVDVDETDKT